MKLVSRLDLIHDYAAQLAAEAVRLGVPRDAFNRSIHDIVYNKYLNALQNSYGGQEQILADIDRKSAEINASFQAQFAFLLDKAGTEYRYRAECLMDEVRAKAAPETEDKSR